MKQKEKDKIDILFNDKDKIERNLNRKKNTGITSPTQIIIRVGEKHEDRYICDDFTFKDKKSINLIFDLLNALLLGEEKELQRIKEEIEKIKIEFSE
ncbi:hypothetical protein EII29_07740 [Leptotrichia sp. OH3620_COT-345]|uniref:hypothetical protein n=1 Tax=Leptotrichia sp. OH3620_COT-345 TaxID=2491048 RepID=UPI000F647CBE|nr:hypothetical protein [Leptotrichia sp. OH3620_COT-345]RRD39290.1 hypothetical protein EII29_07740 [Leptotrichia sp. OH3620_COT-345]